MSSGESKHMPVAREFLPGGRFTSMAPLIMLIAGAYDIPMSGPVARITGGPAWLNSPESVYAIEATVPKDALPEGLSTKDRTGRARSMLQAPLADRLPLIVHREMKEIPGRAGCTWL